MASDSVTINQVANPSPGFTLAPVLDLHVEWPQGYSRDVNRGLHKKDVTNHCPERLRMVVTKTSTSMTNFNSLEHWRDTREYVDVEDLSYSGGAGNPATDAYIYRYRGYIEEIRALSPMKMMLGSYEDFELVILVDQYWVITV